jgi:two-component system LytT family sensor kinase
MTLSSEPHNSLGGSGHVGNVLLVTDQPLSVLRPSSAVGFFPIRVGFLLLPNLLWIAAGVFFAIQITAFNLVTIREAWWIALLDWGPWLVFSPVVLWLSLRHTFGSGAAWWRTLLIHSSACAAIHALMFVLGVAAPDPLLDQLRISRVDLSARPGAERLLFDDTIPPTLELMRVRFVAPIYIGLLMAAHLVVFHHAGRERERRALLAEARLAEARLATLQTQIQPHFLFNTLNAVTSLIADQPRQAEAMLCALADLLRGVLDVSNRREVALAEELDFIDRYLAIQLIRFSDRLMVDRHVSAECLSAVVPPLILQPLVENALIHGIAPRSTPGRVIVSAHREGDRLVLAVTDDGLGLRETVPSQGAGVGLANIRARLDAIHGNAASLELAPVREGGLRATIALPFRTLIAGK